MVVMYGKAAGNFNNLCPANRGGKKLPGFTKFREFLD
jgi:hypothetical protein